MKTTLAVAGLVAVIQTQPFIVDVLDVTSPRTVADTDALTVAGGRRFPLVSAPPVSVSLSLETVDHTNLNDFTYEVIVKNLGPEPVILPWSNEPATAETDVPGAITRWATFSLILVTQDGKRHAFYGLDLFGSSLYAGTLKTVAPGHSVMIRARGLWRLSEEFSSTYFSQTSVDLSVHIEFALRSDQAHWSESVASAAQPVRLKLRQ